MSGTLKSPIRLSSRGEFTKLTTVIFDLTGPGGNAICFFLVPASKPHLPVGEAQVRPGHTARPVRPGYVDHDRASLRLYIASSNFFFCIPSRTSRCTRSPPLVGESVRLRGPAHRGERGGVQTSASALRSIGASLSSPPSSHDDRCGCVCPFPHWTTTTIRRIGSRQRLNDPSDPICELLYILYILYTRKGPCIWD